MGVRHHRSCSVIQNESLLTIYHKLCAFLFCSLTYLSMLFTVMFCVPFLILTLVTVGFMIQPVWSTATPARSGFVMAVETHPAGKIR